MYRDNLTFQCRVFTYVNHIRGNQGAEVAGLLIGHGFLYFPYSIGILVLPGMAASAMCLTLQPHIFSFLPFPFLLYIIKYMGYKAKKTEHAGSKKGCGAYWGRKIDAKRESNRKRREQNRIMSKMIIGD